MGFEGLFLISIAILNFEISVNRNENKPTLNHTKAKIVLIVSRKGHPSIVTLLYT